MGIHPEAFPPETGTIYILKILQVLDGQIHLPDHSLDNLAIPAIKTTLRINIHLTQKRNKLITDYFNSGADFS